MEWTEKYRPKSLKDIVGNRRQRARMMRWGEGWTKGCPLGKCDRTEMRDEIMTKKALILAGPPGIGKTTSALALANDLGWSVIEMNASDTRNSDAVRGTALSGAITQGFTEEGSFISSDEGDRKLIILDEADNLSGNADRGGIKAIVDVIKQTSQPVILIANDLYALQKRSSFFKRRKGSPVEVLRFERPSDKEVEDFLWMVSEKEGLAMERNMIREIALRAAGDIRGALNDLQSFAYSDASVEDVIGAGTRDRGLDTMEALRKLYLSGKIAEGALYLRRTDEQPSNTLLWLDELVPKIAGNNRELAHAYRHLSRADIYLSRVFRRQQYALWKYATDEMAASIVLMDNPRDFPNRLFPLWLVSMGRSKGVRSIKRSLALKMAKYMHTTTTRILQDVLPPFSILFRRDEEFMLEMIWRLRLDEREVDFLIEDRAKAKFAVEKASSGRKRESEAVFGGDPLISTGNEDDGFGGEGSESEDDGQSGGSDSGKSKKSLADGKKNVPPGQKSLFDF